MVYALLHSHLGSLCVCVCVSVYEDKGKDKDKEGGRRGQRDRMGGGTDGRIS